MTLAAIFGCAGPALSKTEAAFFRDVDPWGFILFGRNIETPDQVRRLTSDLRACVGRADAPVLIDQEGGRVARLKPPHWPRYPAGAAYGRLAATDPAHAGEMAWLGGRLIAHDLHAVGINVDCAPVLDVPQPGAHDVIGDRALGETPGLVARLARRFAFGLTAGAVAPVIKHIPGHGRAMADSHEALPVTDASVEDLESVDFAPFRALADQPMAMTAHVVYRALDPKRPATISARVIGETIRGRMGFSGLLMTDDLSMKALGGTFAERTKAALAAGCDIVLHCNGDPDEMAAVTGAARSLEGASAERARRALARVAGGPESFDQEDGRRRFDSAFGAAFATGHP
ncbi:MAG TPA: beta-N-acetylhexosaminidase [Caulobacteraceae bacterium]|nr:beta-N-acetylhexosaminidase [Caulobacteraceae bacterium]